ncbi:MAG: hypothetical protein AB2739_03640, partial [Candidatus Thiodiazotropha endolucinida]
MCPVITLVMLVGHVGLLGCASPFAKLLRSAALSGCRTSFFEVVGSNRLRRNRKPGHIDPGFDSDLVGHEGFEPSTNGLRV